MSSARVTVTLPHELLLAVDARSDNRSAFVQHAIRAELERLEELELEKSLEAPHPESVQLAEASFADWAAALPEGDEDLLDPEGGTAVRWVQGQGWTEE